MAAAAATAATAAATCDCVFQTGEEYPYTNKPNAMQLWFNKTEVGRFKQEVLKCWAHDMQHAPLGRVLELVCLVILCRDDARNEVRTTTTNPCVLAVQL